MDTIQAKYMKLHIQYELIKQQRERELYVINSHCDQIVKFLAKEIAWNTLSNNDETLQVIKMLLDSVVRITERKAGVECD